MSRYAIFGGGGFVGANFIQHMARQGHDFVVVDNLTYTQNPNIDAIKATGRAEMVEGDVRDAAFVKKIVDSGVDGVFHLASLVGIKNYLKNPLDLIDVTLTGTRNVAKACLNADVKMLFTSTSEVLGRNTDVPWKESADRVYGAPTVDRWAYGSSKGVAEQLLNAMHHQLGLKMTIIRFFNVYGPFQRPYFVASKTLYHHLRGEQPLKYDTGKQTRCYTYIGDAVEAVQRVFEAGKANGETYHIGSNFEHTVDDLIDVSARITGAAAAPKVFDTAKEYGKYYEDIDRRVPDVSKIKEHVGWVADTTLEQGMAKFRDWAKANPWWLELNV